jgi:uncharacterized membrane protein YwzB
MNLIQKGNQKAGKINIALGLISDNSVSIDNLVKKENPLKGYFIFLIILVFLGLSFLNFFR